MPEGRTHLPASFIDSNIYVFGGANNRQAQTSVFKLDTEANEWSTLAPMPHASDGHTASVLDGLVYIVGAGINGCEVLSFAPSSGAWRTLAPTSISRKYGASFVLGGCMYVTGGDRGEYPTSVERYEVTSDTWTVTVADMLEGRRYSSAVTIGSAGPVEDQDLFDSLIAKASSRRP
jgi:N-acetylneuraminic acid mutarotase